MSHVIANLELMFGSLAEAKAWAASRPVFQPRVPYTAMQGEDRTVPRICGCLDIRGCFTALGVTGTFRRCLNSNPDAKSYENDDEAYPVLIAKFSDYAGWTAPGKDQVPDIEDTGERWLLSPARPEKIYLKWLDAYSIKMREGKCRTVCAALKFLDDVSSYSHPWLDGRGHPLDCPDMGGDPWPEPDGMLGEIRLDMRMGGNLGLAVPAWPADGTWLFTPFDKNVPPYRTYAHCLRRFSGSWDRDGEPVFEGYVLKWGPDAGSRQFGQVAHDGLSGWHIEPWNGSSAVPLLAGKDRVLPDMSVHIGHGLEKKIKIPDALLPAGTGVAKGGNANV